MGNIPLGLLKENINKLEPAFNTKFLIHIIYMILDGMWCDEKYTRYLSIAFALKDQSDDFRLSLGYSKSAKNCVNVC